jgi:signal transduction histidine kinase
MNDRTKMTTANVLNALQQAALLSGQGESNDALFSLVLSGVAQFTGAGHIRLLAIDPGEGDTRLIASLETAAQGAQTEFAEPASAAIDRTLAEGQAQISDPAPGSSSQLLLPLLSGGRALGVLYADQLSRLPDQADLPLLQALANQAAIALDRSNLNAALEDAEQARREFVSLTTHQLRVPLTSISGYTDLILSGITGPLNERQEQFMQTVRRNAGRMTLLIADLSDINRIQDGRFPLKLEAFDMRALIESVIQEQAETIDGRQHQLARQLPDGLAAAYGDQLAIKRLFEKILANAILYTPPGGSLTVAAVQHDDRIQVTVADTGIGISKADQTQIFTPFFRSEEEAVREHVGWGLSLALAQALIALQDGQLWYESESGAGAVFHFTLPVASNGDSPTLSN